MHSRIAASLVVVFIFGLGGMGSALVRAQTGPGGVGTDDGSSSLSLWLRADTGVEDPNGNAAADGDRVSVWKDQSGNGNDADDGGQSGRQPKFLTNKVNGYPVVKFNVDGQNESNIDWLDVSGIGNSFAASDNTLIAVARTRSPSDTQRRLFDISSGGRLLGYNVNFEDGRIAAVSNERVSSNDKIAIQEYKPYSTVYSGDLDTGILDVAADAQGQGSITGAQGQEGRFVVNDGNSISQHNIVEVIAYEKALSTAEREIVANYLASKYDLDLADADDYYRFEQGHPNGIVGIGKAASRGASGDAAHTSAASSRITILENGSNALSDGEFVMIGHDGRGNSSFSTTENPQGKSTAQKIPREWRAEVTGTSAKTVDVEVDYDGLSLPSGFNDRALFVDEDGDGDFTSGTVTFYDLTNKLGSIYQATGVSIPDGAHLAVAAIERQVQFASSEDTGLENRGGNNPGDTFQPALTAELNYTSTTDLTVDFTVAAGANSPNEDTNDTFDGDGGSDGDDDDFRKEDGSFTISAGTASCNFNTSSGACSYNTTDPPLQIFEEDEDESNTEEVDVTLDASTPSDLDEGSPTTFSFGILDDDNPKKISFADSGDDDKQPTNSSFNPTSETEGNSTLVFEVAVPDGKTGTPTDFTYEITGGTATADEDFELVSARDGTRQSATKGTATIGSSSQFARFEIDVKEDDLFEDDETFDLELTRVTDGAIDPSPDAVLKISVTISDDDSAPDVSFTSTGFRGEESTDADLDVELSQKAGKDLDVTFQDNTTAPPDDPGDYDFDSSGDRTITIPEGNTSGTFTFSVVDDNSTERSETVDVGISSSGANIGSPSAAGYTISDNDGVGSTGPAGVGDESTLAIWLKAQGLGLSDGANVAPWPDSSGNANDVTVPSGATAATFNESAVNGLSAVNFSDGDYYRTTASSVISIPNENNTVFTVSEYGGSGNKEPALSIDKSGGNAKRSIAYASSSEVTAKGGGNSVTASGLSNLTSFRILSSRISGTGTGDLDVEIDAGSARNTASGSKGIADIADIGHSDARGIQFEGQIAEVIAYGQALNTAQRTIVGNYLSSKYDIGIASENDFYAGDTGSNGDRDFGVLGVGQESV